MQGYMGRILRVNLSKNKITEEGTPDEDTLRKYLGCYGLGLKYVYEECPPGTDALDENCPMAFFTGPLTGTIVPGGNQTTLVTKNYNTGFTVGRSHTHGRFGPLLRAAGYDGIIITGRSAAPVYLWIHDGKAEIRDAAALWGKSDTHETEDSVRREVGQSSASVAAIGPGGENLCVGGAIMNDRNHGFCHCGVGSVMGAKHLKAIAVWGKARPDIAHPEELNAIAKSWREGVDWHPTAPIHGIGKGGTGRTSKEFLKRYVKRYGGICAYNMRQSILPGFLEDMEHKVTPRPCPGCPIGCTYDLEVSGGEHRGYVATLSGGGEAIEGAGAIIGITESGKVFRLVDIYDRLGLEGSVVGCTIAMAFEAFEKGLITREDTDGLELKWGDAEVAEKLLRKYAAREGFGDLLARGPLRAAELIGGDAPDFTVHIKGTGMNLHDWRRKWGRYLSQLVSPGAGWPAPGADVRPDADAGFPEVTQGITPQWKALEAFRTGLNKHVNDSIGCCWFLTWGIPGQLERSARAISAATGWDYTKKEIMDVGMRIAHLERAFNVRHGLTPEDDYHVSPRLLAPLDVDPGKGTTIGHHLRGLINEYYRLAGWDLKTGKPWRSTLESVGLSKVARDLWD